ncbi:hypothetical protein GCM10007103_28560 [Salinimicrobium marinum]|uniref:Uncharacterized protein n=1 Tax=Salinimicrobium marinum TaxID=680283 RepID=A0A918SIL6_9FLAO|nr:FG-GAP-like repeat-containing protein [Salinimicrobium marinum]GHA45737.1 hypothetical protein GCM10007103_28560 [Salinimicrobium marinum]
MKQNYIPKILIFFILCLGGKVSFAQTFEQVLPPPPAPQILPDFKGVQHSSIAFADVDGDGDQDVLIAGGSGDMNGGTMGGEGASAILYLNDGSGDYTEATGTPFMGVQKGSVAFADVDGDGDQDVLITGSTGGMYGDGESVAKLYLNNGFGNFSELLDTPFEGVQNSSVAFADVDGDGDQDVLITGMSGDYYNGITNSQLYLNDGNGNYTKDNTNFFEGVQYGSIAFADVDGDSDQDVLITGISGDEWQGVRGSTLYINDGLGNFLEDINTPFPGVGNSSIAFADIDGDNDQDVLITGMDINYNSIAKLYKNDGGGNYSESTGTSFEGVENSSVAFADVDGDSDQDLLITSYNISRLYKNDGSGNYMEDINNSFAGAQYSSIAFADIDGDNDQDVLITGGDNHLTPVAKLYVNIGAGNYVEPTGTFFPGVQNSSIAFADIDGDNDQDVLITGHDNSYNRIGKLYKNDGFGNYSIVTGTSFAEVENGSIAFADVDGDGDQDVLITGMDNSNNRIANLYKNDGSGHYSEVMGTPFTGVQNSSMAFADVDGDGDQDVLITGAVSNLTSSVSSKLYKNDGLGNFSEVTGTPFEGVQDGSMAFADVDGDGDQDVLITGRSTPYSNVITKLYKNNGVGNYTEVTGAPFTGMYNGSVALADIDGDNDQDVLITGYNNTSYRPIAKLYKNDGAGNYSEVTGMPFTGVQNSSLGFADVDGDGFQDVMITGSNDSYNPITKLYKNDGTGNYTEVLGLPFKGVHYGSIAFADIDRDNDKDVLIIGTTENGSISTLYRNTSFAANTPPTAAAVTFSGTLEVGKTLEGNYSYNDTDSDPESCSTYIWYRADDASGTNKAAISEATDKTYELQTTDVGKYISFEVTPNDGTNAGTAVESDLQGPVIAIHPDENNILYVNKNVTGDGSGDSWANALPELAEALKYAKNNESNWENSPLQIWVAGGTYKPLYSPRDGANFADEGRDNAFLLVKNVQLYGGFAGAETALNQRDLGIEANVSILSGDFNGDDVASGSGSTLSITGNSENAYHVVLSSGAVGSARLDGFTISGGNANGSSDFTVHSNTLWRNRGGGMFNSSSSPQLVNIKVVQNSTQNYGAGMVNYDSSPQLVSVIITNNLAIDHWAGGMFNAHSSPKLINVSIVDNWAPNDAAMYNGSSVPEFYNSIVWGGIKLSLGGNYIAQYSLIQDNNNTSNGNIDATGLVEADIFADPGNGDFSLKTASPAINSGNNGLFPGDLQNATDLAGNPRLSEEAIDMGAYEILDSKAPTVVISTTEISPSNAESFLVTVKFSEDVTGFDASDLVVANAEVENFKEQDGSYFFELKPIEDGTVSVDIESNVAEDTAGNSNEAATQFSIESDRTAPTVKISSTESDPSNADSVSINIEFSEKVSGFEVSDLKITNGTAENFEGEHDSFSFDLKPTERGTVKIDIEGNVAEDTAGNANKAATRFSIYFKVSAEIATNSTQTFTYDGTVKNVVASLNNEEGSLEYFPEKGYINVGTYPITVSAAETEHYLAVSKEVNLVIEPATITGVTFEDDSFSYNGEAHSLTVTGLPEGATVAYADNGQINAGTYKVTATVSQENYNDKVLTADLIIEKAKAVITAETLQAFTYDGTSKAVTASLNHSETELAYTSQQGYTNAGTYPVTISAEETDNYLSTSREVSLVIENAEITGVAFEDNTFTYDGTSKSIEVSSLPEGASVSYENNDQTEAGTYEVTATVSQENYNDQVLNADLVINKAAAVITAEAVRTFTYDGIEKSVTASLNHLETELVYTPQQAYTTAGTYEVTVSAEETDNYLSASKEVSLVIENAEIEGVAFEGDTFTYNGEAHSLAVTGLPEGASVEYADNGQINAGTYKVTATISQKNYNDQVLTADLVINKSEAIITADAVQTIIYDGIVKNVAASLNNSEAILTYTPAQGYTDAGTYEVTISSEETDNYLPATKEVSLVIENAEITGVIFEGDTFIYEGISHSLAVTGLPAGATVEYDNNGQTNAGTYTVTATVSQENHNDKILTADLVINKSEAIITADAVQTIIYDGIVKNVAASLNNSETVLNYAPAQGFTNAGTYGVTISSEETDNYLSASKEVSLVIKNAEIEGVAFEDETFTYNGEIHSLAVTGLPEGATVEYANNGQINAGTYTVTATVSQENYNDKILTADLVIYKSEAIITADAVQTFTYDGIVKNVAASLNHSETVLTYAPAQGFTNAGTYDVTIFAEETDNYLATSKEVSLVIENAEIERVAFEDDTFIYNGEAHTLAVSGLSQGASVTYVDNGKINAGTYKVTATVSQENFNDKVLTADLIIKKAEAIITAEAVQTFTYDGTVKNVAASLNHSETVLTYAPAQGFTNAGTYDVTIFAEETDNYLATSKEVSLVIENAEIERVAFEDDTFIYNGEAHTLAVSGLSQGASVTYADNMQINAGTYTVTATVSQENFNDKILTADLIIKKAEALITAEAVQTFTYDGTEKTVTASLNHSETTLTYDPAQGFNDAGTYPITLSAEETDNYLSASEEVSLVIENAEIEGVAFEGETFIYDGTSKSIYVTGLPDGATVKYENNGQINAGIYSVTATISQKNYNSKVLAADLVIEKAETVITADAVQTFTYDRTVKNIVGSLNHEETEMTYAPAQGYTNAGKYDVTISAEETNNYLAASKKVRLVVTSTDIEGVRFDDATFTYDGQPHSLAVSGMPEGASVTYSNNVNVNAGTYTVTANISKENFNDKVLTAVLTIEKAVQSITFEELSDRNLQTDEDFLLHATSTSELAVKYSYTSEVAEPAASVSPRGFVKLLTAGQISITATQSGNQNYEAAAPVTRMLNITSSEAKLNNVVINGTTYASPSAEIYYLIGCGSDENGVQIRMETNRGSSADHAEVFTIATPAPGIYNETITVTSGDGNAQRVYQIKVEKTFKFEDIVVQKFNNVLLVNNNPETNGGYRFESYKWYRNGALIGTGQYFSEGNNFSDQLDSGSTYHVEMITEDGEILRTCSTVIQIKNSYRVVLARNPINSGEPLELLADFPEEELETMQISIHNLNGTILKQLRSNSKATTIELPFNLPSGVYILNCTTNSNSKSLKFIVH